MAKIPQQLPNNYETDHDLPAASERRGPPRATHYPGLNTRLQDVDEDESATTADHHQLIGDGWKCLRNLARANILRRLLRRVVRHGRLNSQSIRPSSTRRRGGASSLMAAAYPELLERPGCESTRSGAEEAAFLNPREGEKLLAS